MKTELVNIKNLKEFAKNIYDNLGWKKYIITSWKFRFW